ncbi:putative p-glycoprotein e [Anopheles sinensis]|uniref:Putative p-glycoprotein e n=1 Tax=Anopheles sinensis TaxID=74873 RepID=A0A084VGH5_ANOSI|nr:putative p-glycoprotein e [Anopheles sinensis]
MTLLPVTKRFDTPTGLAFVERERKDWPTEPHPNHSVGSPYPSRVWTGFRRHAYRAGSAGNDVSGRLVTSYYSTSSRTRPNRCMSGEEPQPQLQPHHGCTTGRVTGFSTRNVKNNPLPQGGPLQHHLDDGVSCYFSHVPPSPLCVCVCVY